MISRKFGYNIANKRNREIFGPSAGQIAIVVIGCILLLFFLIWAFSGEETDVQEEAVEEDVSAEASVPTAPQITETIQPVASASGSCPLIPIVEFTEDNLFGNDAGDADLPDTCSRRVQTIKDRMSTIYTEAKVNEESVLQAEQRLKDQITDLEKTLERLYAEQENLAQARTCAVSEDEEVTEEPVEEDAPESTVLGDEPVEEVVAEDEEPATNSSETV